MKKLLLASTAALVGSAGVAAADGVALSGDGRMGVVYNSGPGNNFMFSSRARVTFTLSGETDTGLAFGGSFRADNADDASSGTAGSVFISGDFGRLTMGDTAGAAQFVVGHVGGVGLTGLGFYNESVFLGNNTGLNSIVGTDISRPTARYDITIDGFTVALSHTNPGSSDTVASIAAGYEFDGFSVGAGYERLNISSPLAPNVDHWIIGAGFEMDGISVKANYGRASSSAGSADQYSIGAGYSMDDIGVDAYYSRNFGGASSMGLGASYDLGGGASLVGGIVRTNVGANAFASPVARRTEADFGISFSF